MFAEEMNCACGEGGNGLTLFATGLLEGIGKDCGSEGAKRSAGGINGKCGGTMFKRMRGQEQFVCACGGLGASEALAKHQRVHLKVVNDKC